MGHYQSESRYSLHVQLTGIEPPIWRSIVVPGAISFHTLHKMLQVVMGWENAGVNPFYRFMPTFDDARRAIAEDQNLLYHTYCALKT